MAHGNDAWPLSIALPPIRSRICTSLGVTVAPDLLCFSHLRWDFVYQRPNHLMARAAADRRVFFIEEPLFEDGATPHFRNAFREGVSILTPLLPSGLDDRATEGALADLLQRLIRREGVGRPDLWYYTPMALPWSRDVDAGTTVYDSMDHLAGFVGAPAGLVDLEQELLDRADLVFCGGPSLHERLRERRRDARCFPSSVDVGHFRRARTSVADPADAAGIPRPRIGYAGVIDERIDLTLIAGVAEARPDFHIVLLGPITKIDPATVPDRSNVHRLGRKDYADLPGYLGGWDIGWMPFARNASTRYISPTKTPEYLAAGLPVVSTSIRDVVEPYGRLGLVAIADDVRATCTAIDASLAGRDGDSGRVDDFLAQSSWDRTWAAMAAELEAARRPGSSTAAKGSEQLVMEPALRAPRSTDPTTRPTGTAHARRTARSAPGDVVEVA